MFMLTFLSKTHPACHDETNKIKAGSNSKMTDRQADDRQAYIYMCVMYELNNSQKYQCL